jgi:hypothetical protein
MAVYALADALADFGKRPQRPPVGGALEERTSAIPADRQPDIEALLEEERARTEKAVLERLAREHEAALAALNEDHAAAVAEVNRQFGEEAGARLEAGLRDIEARVSETVTATVARILGPVVSKEVLERSLDELARAVGEALDDADAVAIRVSGPQSLFSALAAKMGERSKYLRHRDGEGIDLTVDINGSLIETRLTEWQAVVNEVLG